MSVLGAGDSFFEDAVEYAHHLYTYVKGAASPQSARNSPASRARVQLVSEEQARCLEDDTFVMKITSKAWLSLKRKLELSNQNIDVFTLKNMLKKNSQRKRDQKAKQTNAVKPRPTVELDRV